MLPGNNHQQEETEISEVSGYLFRMPGGDKTTGSKGGLCRRGRRNLLRRRLLQVDDLDDTALNF